VDGHLGKKAGRGWGNCGLDGGGVGMNGWGGSHANKKKAKSTPAPLKAKGAARGVSLP